MQGGLKAFLEGDETMLILDPGAFDIWQQDGRITPAGTAAMSPLTPTEITRIITELVLDHTREQGMIEDARVCMVFEEAHSLVPEWNSTVSDGDRSASNGTAKAILQGRKYGLGCLLITQRTANVTKTILNQCNTVFALRTFDSTGLDFLRNYIGDDFAGVLSSLEERHAVLFGRASSCADPILLRLNDRAVFLKSLAGVESGTPASSAASGVDDEAKTGPSANGEVASSADTAPQL
jgi:DNA helicase HerA-like ATPase